MVRQPSRQTVHRPKFKHVNDGVRAGPADTYCALMQINGKCRRLSEPTLDKCLIFSFASSPASTFL